MSYLHTIGYYFLDLREVVCVYKSSFIKESHNYTILFKSGAKIECNADHMNSIITAKEEYERANSKSD